MSKQTKSNLVIALSYAVMAGVAFSFIYGADLALYRPLGEIFPGVHGFLRGVSGSSLLIATALTFFLGGCAVLWRGALIGGGALWVVAGLLLGAGRFYNATDFSHPRHVSRFVSELPDRVVAVRGTVVRDPDHRGRYVNVVIKPERLVLNPGFSGEASDPRAGVVEMPDKSGYVLARIYPMAGDYYEQASYGDRIEVRMPLMPTQDLTNPSGFNYGRYLRARNIYATSPPWGVRNPGQVEYLGPGDVSALVRLSLKLKQQLLASIRRTMPYPESAFLGGVTLGLRAGLPEKIKLEFQETGVAHVLAVSGLHVGFVHALLLMLCRVFRIQRRMSYFVIVFGLIVFAIITGASPATQRAVLMSSIGQAIFTFGGFGIKGSTVLTIPLVGAILLLSNPLWAPDGSFVLSIVAVWSLAHLSEPVDRWMKTFCRGWKLLALIFFTLAWAGLSVLRPEMYREAWVWGALGGGLLILMAVAARMDALFPLAGFDIFVLPRWMTGLIAAQGAILLGMTFPLSAVYFQRFSVSGVFANLIAIPLIGFIVQLGLLAGLIDIVLSALGLGWLGTFAALCVNAANWYLCKFFLAISAFFSDHFPYPYLPMPSWGQLIVYYLIVLAVMFWEELAKGGERLLAWARTPARRWAAAGLPLLLLFGFAARDGFSVGRARLRMVFFDCGSGNTVLVRTPEGKSLLIDGGPLGRGGWGTGETILAPALAKYNIHSLDTVVLTSPRVASGGGLPFVLKYFPAKEIVSPLDLAYFSTGMTLREFLAALGDPFLYHRPHNPESHETFVFMHDLLSEKDFRSRHRTVRSGETVYEEGSGPRRLQIKALWPPSSGGLRGTGDDIGNNSLVLKLTYGETSFLFATQIRKEGEWALLDHARAELKSDWLLVPGNGAESASTNEFLDAVEPSGAVMQYGYVSWRERRRYHPSPEEAAATAERYRRRGIDVYRTDRTGAVLLSSDGKSWQVNTILSGAEVASLEPVPVEEAREVTFY